MNTRNNSTHPPCLLPTPEEVKNTLPHAMDTDTVQRIHQYRQTIRSIMNGKDRRLLAIVGPCSIHCLDTAWEYAQMLRKIQPALSDQLFIVMRVYMEKPRTGLGWTGYLYDPSRNGTVAPLTRTLADTRRFFTALTHAGIPIATEFVHPLLVPYLSDFPTWVAIGARTVHSPVHRALAAALPMPVGFKNPLCGRIEDALHAIHVASTAQYHLDLQANGQLAHRFIPGNPDTHLVLRGSRSGPNYHYANLCTTRKQLIQHPLPPRLLVDCSHDNSGKNPLLQTQVLTELLQHSQRLPGLVKGFMLESFLKTGRQSAQYAHHNHIEKGKSITDACLGWEETQSLLEYAALQHRDHT